MHWLMQRWVYCYIVLDASYEIPTIEGVLKSNGAQRMRPSR